MSLVRKCIEISEISLMWCVVSHDGRYNDTCRPARATLTVVCSDNDDCDCDHDDYDNGDVSYDDDLFFTCEPSRRNREIT